jgi:hypothetical protein
MRTKTLDGLDFSETIHLIYRHNIQINDTAEISRYLISERRAETVTPHLVCTFVRALHAFYGVEGPRLDVLCLYNLAEGSLALLSHKPILSHGKQAACPPDGDRLRKFSRFLYYFPAPRSVIVIGVVFLTLTGYFTEMGNAEISPAKGVLFPLR